MRMIRRFSILAAAFAVAAAPASAANPDPLKTVDVDRLVQRTMALYQVPGIAVGVVKDGRLVFAKGYGVRELGKPGAVDPDTLFAIASNSKAFTTAALAILVDEGKIHWDDRVIDYLPEFRLYDPYVTREFRIRDLLTHRSGLGLGAGDLLLFPNTDFDRKDVLHALQYLKPVTSFRSEFAYDNNLYIVAGQIIPAVTGESWEDFVTSRILAPLHMAPCVATQARLADRSNVASPHAPVEGKVVPISPDDTRMAAAAGGIQCNITGLAKWQLTQLGHGQAKNGPRIFSEAQSEEMWKPQTITYPTGKRAELTRTHFGAYGLGWGLEDFNGYKRLSHSGGLEGMVTYQSLIPELNLGVIVLTNAQEGEAFATIALQIIDAYTGDAKRDWVRIIQGIKAGKVREQADSDAKRVPPPAAGVDLSKLDLDAYSGTYADAWRGEAFVTREPQGLVLSFSHTNELSGPLTALRPGLFVVHWKNRAINADAYVRFGESFSGAVEGFTMQPVSATTDFSFDFQDLDFHRVPGAATAK
jgi:CubicO group peptidase (beta-lactamase class C family)